MNYGGLSLPSAQELGEREIIDILSKCLEGMLSAPVPFGDDASAVDILGGDIGERDDVVK